MAASPKIKSRRVSMKGSYVADRGYSMDVGDFFKKKNLQSPLKNLQCVINLQKTHLLTACYDWSLKATKLCYIDLQHQHLADITPRYLQIPKIPSLAGLSFFGNYLLTTDEQQSIIKRYDL